MFVLDTTVVSEAFKANANAGVVLWMDSFVAQSYVSAMTKAELLLGLAAMTDGKRKASLNNVLEAFFDRLKTPILAFGSREAELYAPIVLQRRLLGRPIDEFDAQIAAVARSHGFAVVTRNVRDFENCGVEVINPWEGA